MSTLTNPFGGINPSVGTSQRESIGSSLAGLVSTSLQAYAKVQEIDKQFTAEEDAKLSESEMIAYNSILAKTRVEDNNLEASTMNNKDFMEHKQKQRKTLEESTNGFKSSWYGKNSSKLISVFDNQIDTANVANNIELRDNYIANELPEFSKTALFGSEEFETVYNTISSFKTGKDFTKEDFVSAIAKSNIGYFEQISARVKNGDLRSFDASELKGIRDNVLDYIKNPILKAKVENSYASVVNDYKTKYGDKISLDNTELLYGDGSLTYNSRHKQLYNQVLKDSNISESDKQTMINRLTMIKKSSLGGTSTGLSKEAKAILKAKETDMMNTFDADGTSKSDATYRDLSAELNNEDMKNTYDIKQHIGALISNGKYNEVAKITSANSTIPIGDKRVPYKAADVSNWIKIDMQNKEDKLSTMERGTPEYQNLLADVRKMEFYVPNVSSSVGGKAKEALNNSSIAFTDLSEAERQIDYANAFQDGNTNDSLKQQQLSVIMRNTLEKLKTQYGEGEDGKILAALNITKNNFIGDHYARLKITDDELQSWDVLENWTGTDITKSSFTKNTAFMIDQWQEAHPGQKLEPDEKTINQLRDTSTEAYSGPLNATYIPKALAGQVVDTYDAVLIPLGNDALKTSLDKIIGKTISYKGRDIDIPSLNDMDLVITSKDSVRLQSKDTGAIIFDLSKDEAYRISQDKYVTKTDKESSVATEIAGLKEKTKVISNKGKIDAINIR